MKRKWFILIPVFLIFLFCINSKTSLAANISVEFGDENSSSDVLEILSLLTVMAFIPAIVIMMTGFTRIVIVLSFLRNALGLQQTPPNQVLVGLALFLTLFVMMPVISRVNTEAYIPY